jgi:ABC-type Fe3+ transport system substrate-binding protein
MSEEKNPIRYLIIAVLISIIAIGLSGYSIWSSTNAINTANSKIDSLTGVMEKSYGVNMSVIMAAIEEKTVMLYTSTTLDATRKFGDSFQKKYPFLTVDIYRGTGFAILEKFRSEHQAGIGVCDIMFEPMLEAGPADVAAGYFAPCEIATADRYNFTVPGYLYPIQASVSGVISWNTNLVSAEDVAFIKANGWSALADPRWKDRCAATFPGAGVTAYSPNYYFLVDAKDKYGETYLRALAANKPKIFTSQATQTNQLIAGEFAIGYWTYESVMFSSFDKGAPVQWYYPPPTSVAPEYIGISSRAPHPNAARLFMEYAFSEEGQKAWQSLYGGKTLMNGIPELRPAASASWYKGPTEWFYPQNVTYWISQQTTILAKWGEIFNYQPA